MKRIKITNGIIITPDHLINDGVVVIEDGIISYIGNGNIGMDDCLEIEAGGRYIAPGFVDIHCHGGAGYDFMDGTQEAFLRIAEFHAQHGTTRLFPTSMTSSEIELKRFLSAYNNSKGHNIRGADMVGLHLEGPYLSLEKSGAQNQKYIQIPYSDNYMKILNWSNDISRWSIAPELPGAYQLAQVLSQQHILLSIAHTNIDFDDACQAVSHGFTHVTHLYSGMNSVMYVDGIRKAGAVEAALYLDGMTVEIIADGIHLPAGLIELIYKIKGADRIAIITDAMRATGTHDKESVLGSKENGQRVVIENGVAKRMDRRSLAGSISSFDQLVRFLYQSTTIPLTDIIKMASLTPANILGLRRSGCLKEGNKADVILFDENISVQFVMIGGVIVKDNRI